MPGLKDMSMHHQGTNKREVNEKPIMPYHRNSVNSNGYSTDQQSIIHVEERNEAGGGDDSIAPTYVIEHLATFTVSKNTGIVYPADGMRRLLQLEKSNGIWSQKMQLRLDQQWVMIMDFETGVVMERFPISLVKEPTAFTSNDPMEIYNNILVFVVGQVDSRSEMHIFQCQSIPAQELVEDLKLLRSGKGISRKTRHMPPPPPSNPPPLNGVSVREQVSVFNAVAHHSDSTARVDDETSSTSSEKYERDVIVLNHCFDDIEKFIARLQHAAAASRELERRRRNRKSKKKDIGDGMLTMRAKPPPEIEFVDIFQKFKLSFNLLAKLKAHIHDPNAPELVHFLFTPLALIVDASHDTHYKPNIPSRVVSPLLTRDAINLLMNCVTSKETELWHSLGDAWLIPREQWKGYVAPYHPIFMDGWSPEYPIPVSSSEALVGPVEHKKSREEIKNIHPEGEFRDGPYHHRDRQHGVGDDSSDYFEYEHEQPTGIMQGIRPHYTYNSGHPEQFNSEDRDDSHSLEGESEPDFNTLSLHSPPRMEKERVDVAARSDISADSIERNMTAGGPSSERFERAQARWLEDMRNRGVKIVQVTYPRTANNDKELSVIRGELLEILDDSRKWWKARNSRSQVAHVPHTIVTPFNPMLDSSDVFTNPVYTKGYDKRSASQSHNYSVQESMKSEFVDQSISSEQSRSGNSVPQSGPAPADWVRKERIGKKGEFRYF
ncbi:epidermal growth factor receptor kinase substrate 8-like [Daktulosphaira vitifoliae]|uniref:epidermal growth factor receptor kinase substrate 8-like n=1 Tax=Daktulosphaira vitifoliae TaxID=58002 RepID=UPI0021AA16F6|nr:epidermal growth factor receptor kinase substrate 8-like [Daktulosphaira vitifoliae]